MKVISVVGPKNSGKTRLVTSLVPSLKKYGRVGTIKHMPGHSACKGDTKRHFDAGADVVVGVGRNQIKITGDSNLDSALAELIAGKVDFAIIEGFKTSHIPKIVLGGIEVQNSLRKLNISDLDEALLEELTELVLSLGDYSA